MDIYNGYVIITIDDDLYYVSDQVERKVLASVTSYAMAQWWIDTQNDKGMIEAHYQRGLTNLATACRQAEFRIGVRFGHVQHRLDISKFWINQR